jgi:D-glycero-D-manno-heptose 1,7-bisphosphate phosphatase
MKRGSRLRSAIFIDRDNTLIKDLVNGRKATDDLSIENSTANAIRKINKAGIPIFLVSNQPAVAKGFINYSDVLATQAKLENELRKNEAIIDDFRFCQHHPEKGHLGEVIDLKIDCKCRKPKVGMVIDLSKTHDINVAESILIGDSETDSNLAVNTGMVYIKGNFGTGEVAIALLNALDRLLLSNDN